MIVNDNGKLAYIWLLIKALSGITVYIIASKHISKSKLLEYLGRNSLIIMSLHIPFGLCIIEKLALKFNQPYNVLGIIQTIFILFILYPIIEIINKHFSFIVGRRLNR